MGNIRSSSGFSIATAIEVFLDDEDGVNGWNKEDMQELKKEHSPLRYRTLPPTPSTSSVKEYAMHSDQVEPHQFGKGKGRANN
ncbi:hypothetical protein M422DRAFT_261752 [Sphaerobolus stellatus SS14]|uniref:Uncharacterized protein n=1 Tax=Sphaerobolus stellatus (strain SS14) TaxID=990650 RepID=A0A0C9VEZ8_SPHS4|nr:hypothetical protein M422DRAFT_261752 [Sphaerobolus stellatus SS14]